MYHPPSGLFPIAVLLRSSRAVLRWRRLMVPAVVVLTAVLSVLVVPAPTGAVDVSSGPDAGEATALSPAAHEGTHPGESIGAPMSQDDTASSEPGPSPAAGDEPVGPADRELLHKVKQAGLWEMPVGTWVSERAVDEGVREVGRKISAEHHELDEIVESAAARLDVRLPAEPTDEQQGWMADIDGRDGAAFDQRAVFLLRRAHGNVLPVLAQVRVSTRNAVIRQFSTEAMVFVERHIAYLESTGLVNYQQLPTVPDMSNPGWRSHAVTFAVFSLFTALFTTLLILVGRAMAAWRRGRVTSPLPTGGGHRARSRS
jgi:predicted outer membrane protein